MIKSNYRAQRRILLRVTKDSPRAKVYSRSTEMVMQITGQSAHCKRAVPRKVTKHGELSHRKR